jgi:ketosteroid isomerase-like protein
MAVAMFGSASVSSAGDKADIEARIKALNAAIEKHDIDGVMANYTPGEDIVVFDVIPPTQYVGATAWRKDWQGALADFKGPIKIEIRELKIRNAGNLGVAHYIQHWATQDPKGKPTEYTFRITDSLVKAKGGWLIDHEHLSLPVDLSTNKADLSGK